MPPEMVELAKFSKVHIPQEHPRDSPMHIRSRIGQLCAARESSGPNVINALVALASSTDSAGVHELIARVFAAIACRMHNLLHFDLLLPEPCNLCPPAFGFSRNFTSVHFYNLPITNVELNYY